MKAELKHEDGTPATMPDLEDEEDERLKEVTLIVTPESGSEKAILREWLKANEHERVCVTVAAEPLVDPTRKCPVCGGTGTV